MRLLTLLLLSLLIVTNSTAQESTLGKAFDKVAKGIASFYHDKFEGRKTATGEIFDNDKFTAASNNLKLNTYVKVTNQANGEVVYVRINDRMSKNNHRLIDLAEVAAEKLDFRHKGVTKVKVEVVPEEEGRMAILVQKGELPSVVPAKNEL